MYYLSKNLLIHIPVTLSSFVISISEIGREGRYTVSHLLMIYISIKFSISPLSPQTDLVTRDMVGSLFNVLGDATMFGRYTINNNEQVSIALESRSVFS